MRFKVSGVSKVFPTVALLAALGACSSPTKYHPSDAATDADSSQADKNNSDQRVTSDGAEHADLAIVPDGSSESMADTTIVDDAVDTVVTIDGAVGDSAMDANPQECTPGATKCSNLQPQTCGSAGTWQNSGTACPILCDSSTATCTGSCAPNAKRCNGLQPQTCSASSAWEDTGALCPYACAAGTCTGVCVPGSKKCQSLQPQLCDATGQWQNMGSACPMVCTAGSCTACTASSKQCNGLQPQTCGASGAWQDSGAACPYVCSSASGSCTGTCAPTAKKCNGLQPQTCDANGAWQNTGSACPYVCNNTSGSCTGSCTPAAKRCSGLQPQTCSSAGAWQNTGTACAFLCDNATVTCTGSCTPTAKRCSNSQPQVCDSTGTWKNSGSACTGCYVCSTATGVCAAAPANTSCNDGNACTQPDSCQSGTCVGTPITCPAPAACHVTGVCSSGSCTTPTMADGLTDTKCPSSTRVCLSGTCVQCLSDANCSGSTPSCDTASHKCVCRRPSPGNLVKNPGFDSDLSSWSQIFLVGSVTWSDEDSEGCSGSGSAAGDTDGDPVQCVPVTAGRSYYFGVKFKLPLANNQHYCELLFRQDSQCTGSDLGSSSKIGPTVNVDGAGWASFSTTVQVPTGTQGAFIECYMLNGKMDQIYVNAADNKF